MIEYRRLRTTPYEFGLPVRIVVQRPFPDAASVRIVRDVATALAVRDGWLARMRRAGWTAVWDGSTIVVDRTA